MSATIVQEVISVAYTEQSFPAGQAAVASISAVFTGTATGNTTPVTVSIPLAATSITVPLTPDTYSWTLTNLDASGNTIGTVATGTGVVNAPVTLSLASGLTFS
jgi:hypothetical protein